MRIKFDKIDKFLRVFDKTVYLVLFGSEKCNSIENKIKYLISVKSGITYMIFDNYAKIKADSYNFLPLERTITFCNILIFIKSIFDKHENNYYYNIFLENPSGVERLKTLFLWKTEICKNHYD